MYHPLILSPLGMILIFSAERKYKILRLHINQKNLMEIYPV